MNKRHYFNDLSHLFEQGPTADFTKMEFECPVCEKKYNTRAGVEKHMKKQECAPAVKMFSNTLTEDLALAFFKETVGEYSPKQVTTVKALRKSKSYKPLMRFILHCMNNKTDPYMFFWWITNEKKPKYYIQALSLGMKDSILVQFRNFLVKNQHLIESEQFFDQNRNELLKDDWMLIRSLERGDIGLNFCIDNEEIDLYDRASNMNAGMRASLANIITTVEK